MRAAVYARFSSENQREQSIEDQVRVCGTFAAREQITVLESHIYCDEAQSGSVRARPGLEALKKAAEDKPFDAVRRRAEREDPGSRSIPSPRLDGGDRVWASTGFSTRTTPWWLATPSTS
jgi:hypothetical protein